MVASYYGPHWVSVVKQLELMIKSGTNLGRGFVDEEDETDEGLGDELGEATDLVAEEIIEGELVESG